jgi:hypothetical protein
MDQCALRIEANAAKAPGSIVAEEKRNEPMHGFVKGDLY